MTCKGGSIFSSLHCRCALDSLARRDDLDRRERGANSILPCPSSIPHGVAPAQAGAYPETMPLAARWLSEPHPMCLPPTPTQPSPWQGEESAGGLNRIELHDRIN